MQFAHNKRQVLETVCSNQTETKTFQTGSKLGPALSIGRPLIFINLTAINCH